MPVVLDGWGAKILTRVHGCPSICRGAHMTFRWKDFAIATGGLLAAGAAAVGILTGLRELSVLPNGSPPDAVSPADKCGDSCQKERAQAEKFRVEAELIRANFETCPPLSSAQSDRILNLVADQIITADQATELVGSLTCRLFKNDEGRVSDGYVARQYGEEGLPMGLELLLTSDNGAVRRAFVNAVRADFSQASVDQLSLAVDQTSIPIEDLPPETGGTKSGEQAGFADLLLATGMETTVCREWGDVCEPGMIGYEKYRE